MIVADKFLTPEQVAESTQLCTATIRRLCARGEIRATKLAGQWRIPESAYRDWLASGEPEPGVIRPQPRNRMVAPASRWHLRAINGGES